MKVTEYYIAIVGLMHLFVRHALSQKGGIERLIRLIRNVYAKYNVHKTED